MTHCQNKKNGFTLLLVLLVISITLAISLGAANIIIGQVGISRITRDSKIAFFAANGGLECALYGDIRQNVFSTSTVGILSCAGQNFSVGGSEVSSFLVNFSDGSCADVTVTKAGPESTDTNVKSRGRNKCPIGKATVERGLEIEANFSNFNPGKPVIYLYPEEKMEVVVRTWPKLIEESIPPYNNGWRVIASPDGTLFNLSDGKKYPYLFWEGKSNNPKINRTKGFVIKTEEVENFLAEKLQKLGLNRKETADFIEYWAPRMKSLSYVYVYFMPQPDFDKLIPIEIIPNPDTIIRVYMLFKSLDEPITVHEQEIITPQRKGFTAVEWGGDRAEIR